MKLFGIEIEERNETKTILKIHKNYNENVDIKFKEGKVFWFNEKKVSGIEEANEILGLGSLICDLENSFGEKELFDGYKKENKKRGFSAEKCHCVFSQFLWQIFSF